MERLRYKIVALKSNQQRTTPPIGICRRSTIGVTTFTPGFHDLQCSPRAGEHYTYSGALTRVPKLHLP